MSQSQFSRRNLMAGGLASVAAVGVTAVPAHAVSSSQSSVPSESLPSRSAQNILPRRRKLGNLEVSSLGLGCQGLGETLYGVQQPSREDAITLIRLAYEHGVTFFDTAEAYGPFESERLVGEALHKVRDEVKIATKYGWDIDQQTGQMLGGVNSKPEHIKLVVDNMLRRLNTDRIDLLYQHRADPEVPVEEVAGTIQELMQQGKVLNWGLCEVSPETIRKAHAVEPLTAIQSEYSLFFRGRENDVIPVCEELGIGFVPWSPLAMGALAGYVDENTRFTAPDLRASIPMFSPEAMQNNVRLINLVKQWAQQKLCTPAQLSLAWLQAQHDFIVPIPGTTKSYHLMDNLGADGVRFTSDELERFTRELDAITIEGARLPQAVLDFSEVA